MKNTFLRKVLQKENILKHGDFILRSGIRSSYYCDIKEALGKPKILNRIIDGAIALIPKATTCIAASGYGGITLASIIAHRKKLPIVLVRDKVKNHGTKKIIDGYVPTKNDFVCIVDDVFTTESSIKYTKQKLVFLKCKFVTPVVVLNRSTKKSVVSILSDKDLCAQ